MPFDENFIRVKDYINYLKLEEDEEQFILSGLGQVDIKVNLFIIEVL